MAWNSDICVSHQASCRGKIYTMRRSGIIFDGDDTLWETMPLYTDAKSRFVDRMATFGFAPAAVKERFEELDLKNLSEMGFTTDRFPTSMVHTYRSFCRDTAAQVDPIVEHELRQIGESVFRSRPISMPNVQKVLAELGHLFDLTLLTKGDTAVQRARIEQSGLQPLFRATYIVPHKDTVDFQRIVHEQHLDATRSWSVGNSLKADINPALAAGLAAVWIPYETWAAENDDKTNSPRFYIATSLIDCARIILQERLA
jgi:putative hydrolase of the HAD superfamily